MNPAFPENKLADQDFNQTQIHLSSTQEITWSVRKLHYIPTHVGCALDSPPFVFQNATWCLRLYNTGTSEGVIPLYFRLRIVRLSSLVPHHRVMYRAKLKDSGKWVRYHTADFDEDHKETADYIFFDRRKLLDSGLYLRTRLDVICQVSCYQSPYAVDAFSQTEPSIQESKDVGALSQSLRNLLLNGQDHDVVLKVKDKEFRAHRNILRARSPVLESMLSHDMIEKNSGAIDIPDCDPFSFEQFLLYLYSGQVETLDKDNMLSLYYIADKYDAEHLKEECRQFIMESFSIRNITAVVQTALDHSDADLLLWSTDYFVDEVDDILPTVEWLSFLKRNPVQANELFIKSRMKKINTDLIEMGRKT